MRACWHVGQLSRTYSRRYRSRREAGRRLPCSSHWHTHLRLPFVFDDATYICDTIRREHSPPLPLGNPACVR